MGEIISIWPAAELPSSNCGPAAFKLEISTQLTPTMLCSAAQVLLNNANILGKKKIKILAS